MSISRMTKVMLASHKGEAKELLESIQDAGIMEVLDAEKAMVSKEWPELVVSSARPRDIEETIRELKSGISFLNNYREKTGGLFAAKPAVARSQYLKIVSGKETLDLLEQSLKVQGRLGELESRSENISSAISMLEPWVGLSISVEEMKELTRASCVAGIIPDKCFDEIVEKLGEMGAAVEDVGNRRGDHACLIAGLKENHAEILKVLRAGDFEEVRFDNMAGGVSELIEGYRQEKESIALEIRELAEQASKLAEGGLDLEVLHDHYQNLLEREQTWIDSPETEHTIILEGWVKRKDYKRLEKIVNGFEASSLSKMELAEDEFPPIEIDNAASVKPFETITRLHGMPNIGDVDPTAFLAPFFALFFGLCLTDAGYGIIIAIIFWWLIKKFQGDKKALWMFLICSVSTIIAGALTGGWFGDAIQSLLPQDSSAFKVLNGFRESIMLFDPMQDPMTFFVLSIGLGYFQIMFAICIGFFNKLLQKDYATAIFNHLTWLIFLNCLLVMGLSKAGIVSEGVSKLAGWVAISQAVIIFLFTERKSGIAGRIGGGVFALFSTVFYFGDVLSYVRLMALGMVTAGLGMAINILVKLVMDVPYVGFILGALLFVVGHSVNIALSVLSSFVHSLRLQFVEFFPKFFVGGGRAFEPLQKKYEYILMNTKKEN